MPLEQASDLAERTLAAIPDEQVMWGWGRIYDADRERVASDLAGLREHDALSAAWCVCDNPTPCPDARRYADGLRRTGALYGVTP